MTRKELIKAEMDATRAAANAIRSNTGSSMPDKIGATMEIISYTRKLEMLMLLYKMEDADREG